jgi:glutathionyl-hydroquinone reductase
MDEELSDILAILNSEYRDDITDDTIKINGKELIHDVDEHYCSSKVYETLYDGFISFSRVGYKNISYDRWVDTNWNGWE